MAGIRTGIVTTQIRKEIGTVLKAAREKRGLTQHDIASRLGYTTPQFISNCERGLCFFPREKYKALKKEIGRAPVEQIIELQAKIYHASLLKSLG